VLLNVALLTIGAALIVAGVALLSVPVALIVAGVAVAGFALTREDGA
jgi:hypothetical protein